MEPPGPSSRLSEGERIPGALLDEAVTGVNLMPGSLRDQLGDVPTLLVFLRHFGCVFCRETLADLRACAERDRGYPPILFFFQGTPTEGRALLRRDWPTVRAVADPAMRFYDGFGVEHMNWTDLLRPGLWIAERRAHRGGHRSQEGGGGDVWRMPGAFLVRGDRILWSHVYRHAGDRPDWATLAPLARTRV